MQRELFSMGDENVNATRVKASILDTLSSDPHLSDVQLIEFSSGLIGNKGAAECEQHIQRCSACAAEVAALNAHLAVWNSPAEIERLESRIGRPAAMANKPVAQWWSKIADWVSVAPLRATMGARAAASAIDVEVINFPVHGETEIAPGLSGIIQRRGQEFQIRITPSSEQKVSYQDRLVEVVLVESGTENVLLQRNIPIDRFVLLGTDLPIRTERIAAKLIT